MKALALACTLVFSADCLAVAYRSVTISEDNQHLTISSENGDVDAPRTRPDQEGFSDARISPNGRSVGWLVLAPGCCTSYPLPMSLIVFRDGKIVRIFDDGEPPIFGWIFQDGDKAIAYRQSTAHGAKVIWYKLKRVSDGKTIAEFDCDPNGPDDAVSQDAPAWVWPIADGCPLRKDGK
jgi:hypothetical protein